ncbi:MAG: septum formation family protein [Microthrixaceae bacterium]
MRSPTAALAPLALVTATLMGCGAGDAEPAPTTAGPTSTTSAPPTQRDLSQPADNAVPEGVENLELGDCYDPAPDPSQRTVLVLLVPCEQPHQYEVYHVDAFTESRRAGYPGDNAVRNYAEERCFESFEGFVGQVWRDSLLDIETWFPTSASWTQGADRKLTCVLFHRNRADLTGSMAGSRR